MDEGKDQNEQGENGRLRAPRESHSCMDPRRLAIVRARDALRKRRWRERRRMEKTLGARLEDRITQSKQSSSTTPEPQNEVFEEKKPTDLEPLLSDKQISKRAGISPDKLREMRAKDAERKRRARLRKRLISSRAVEYGIMAKVEVIEEETTTPMPSHRQDQEYPENDGEEMKEDDAKQEEQEENEDEVCGESALAQLSIDVHYANGEPSTASDSGLSSILSPHSAFSPLSSNHNTPKGCSRLPRKLLTPNQLLEVRSKDNARKRVQRSRKKMEQQHDMAKNLLDIMNGATEALAAPAFNALTVGSILKMSSPCVLNPLLGTPGAALGLSSALNPFPLIGGPSLLCGPSLPFSNALKIDTDFGISTSAPASLLGSRPDPDPMELFRSLVEKVSQSQFSPKVQSEERAAAKRAARAARIARMTEEQKDALRASDRERKRLWRQRRRELQGNSLSESAAAPSSGPSTR